MINKCSVSAALAVAGFIALAGCSSGDHHADAQNASAAPAQTVTAVQAPVAAETPEVSPGLMKRVQVALHGEGFYSGRVDGLWGPQTQGAIRSYQQSHNLTNSGEIDSATLTSLKLASASAAPAPLTTMPAPAAPITN